MSMHGGAASGGGIGQAASELLKELQKSEDPGKMSGGGKADGASGAQFQQTLQETQNVQSTQQVQETQKVSSSNVLSHAHQHAGSNSDATLAKNTEGAPSSTTVGGAEKAESSHLLHMIQKISQGESEMNKIMSEAMSGKQFSPADLIGMQAKVFHFTQELDLTSKVIEKATGGIKQTLSTQL